ncbi:ATP-binding protein [Phenylobacterium sp.]|uniref:ATP-binding protein n=1 Tax=Phenylobacterium sp. TaxID=1871053 RepID=UPI003D2ACCDE
MRGPVGHHGRLSRLRDRQRAGVLARRGGLALRKPGIDPNQAALATLIGRLPLRIIMVDRQMRVLAASKSSVGGLRMGNEDFLGRDLFEIDPLYFGPYRPIAERCLVNDETFTAPRVRARQAEGDDVWLRTEISPWRDSRGEIGGLVSVSVEITDVMESLAASERSEARLNLALEIAEVHVWELDFRTREMTTAGASATFFDGSISDAEIAADTSITIHPDHREEISKAWEEALLSDTPYKPEYRVNRRDGKEVWAACTSRLVRNDKGQPTQLVGAMQNITARKAAEAALLAAKEEAEAANRAKSVFLATMSHEIRTPLNGVLGMAQAMAVDELSDPQRTRLETIRQSGETLLVILNDLLDLSKIEAGKLELEVTDFPLRPLLDGVRATYSDLAARKGLRLVLDVCPAAAGVYRGDSTRLRQILFNLVSNALKFTQVGEVRLIVQRDGETLVCAVRDTGIGIPTDRLARLFNKFEQADVSTTRKFGGTGLGLAISRELATLMGGAISVESQLGEGSEFTLRLPLRRISDEPAAPAIPAPPPIAPQRPLRVLAAEDNSVNQTVLRTLLQQTGVEPEIVDDGAAAVAAWRAAEWDVILMDVQMPVMDGPDATRAIRAAETQSGRARTPIIALTANAMAHQVEEYAQAGMDGLIAKPIRVGELFAALQAVLDDAEDEEAAA